ncbi:hypothetical protein Taro_010149 [Colocasia esculenta]|uniref:Uncharacterized protein n=1 Tax=Colocasia esculenta TaxID=4460 RepID=A0A843TY56_COLES|nr:hypothetical protein [Colocasia esculenta]
MSESVSGVANQFTWLVLAISTLACTPVLGLWPENLASRSLVAKLLSQDVNGQTVSTFTALLTCLAVI